MFLGVKPGRERRGGGSLDHLSQLLFRVDHIIGLRAAQQRREKKKKRGDRAPTRPDFSIAGPVTGSSGYVHVRKKKKKKEEGGSRILVRPRACAHGGEGRTLAGLGIGTPGQKRRKGGGRGEKKKKRGRRRKVTLEQDPWSSDCEQQKNPARKKEEKERKAIQAIDPLVLACSHELCGTKEGEEEKKGRGVQGDSFASFARRHSGGFRKPLLPAQRPKEGEEKREGRMFGRSCDLKLLPWKRWAA